MKKENFITYDKILKTLKDNTFYGFTVKRVGDNKVTYTFVSCKWNNITITVDTLKLNPKKIPSDKIVLGINMNETQLDTFKDFIDAMKNLYKINKQTQQYNKE